MKQFLPRTLFILLGTIFVKCLLGIDVYAISPDQLNPPKAEHTQIIELEDGSSLIGDVISINDQTLTFKTAIGELAIEMSKIVSIKEVPLSSFRNGKYWFPNPNRTRLYIAPTAFMLEPGKGYFNDIWIFFPGITIGLTKNFTIGGGMSIFPGVDPDDQIFYLTPKLGVATKDKFALALGVLIVKVPDWDNDSKSPTVGIAYGVGTIGTTDNSFSVGLGFGFVDNEFADKPMVMVGAQKRLSRRTAFVTENWIFPGVDDPLISYGIRFFGEKIAVDLAFVNVAGEGAIFPGIPFVSFNFNF